MVRALASIARGTGLSPVQSTLFHLSHSCFKEIFIIYQLKTTENLIALMTADSWKMCIQMFWQMACRSAIRWINCRWQFKRSRSLRPDCIRLLAESQTKVKKHWLGGLNGQGTCPDCKRYRFEPCLIHPFSPKSQLFQRNIYNFYQLKTTENLIALTTVGNF